MERNISYFNAPVAPYTSQDGRKIMASMVPVGVLTVERLHMFITRSEELQRLTMMVRSAKDMSLAKKTMLPYVTPYGTFTKRSRDGLAVLSGYMPVDIDHLESEERARQLRDMMADNAFLGVALAFVSPSGKGVKLFIRYDPESVEQGKDTIERKFKWVSIYIKSIYNIDVDVTGKDVCRACFISYDPEAKYNEPKR